MFKERLALVARGSCTDQAGQSVSGMAGKIRATVGPFHRTFPASTAPMMAASIECGIGSELCAAPLGVPSRAFRFLMGHNLCIARGRLSSPEAVQRPRLTKANDPEYRFLTCGSSSVMPSVPLIQSPLSPARSSSYRFCGVPTNPYRAVDKRACFCMLSRHKTEIHHHGYRGENCGVLSQRTSHPDRGIEGKGSWLPLIP